MSLTDIAVNSDVPKCTRIQSLAGDGYDLQTETDIAGEAVGGRVLFATDQWFASADNIIKQSQPEWKEGKFTNQGKWMDGWESRRKRTPGHDWCLIRLGVPGRILAFDVDTAFFTGNYPPSISIEAAPFGSITEDPFLHSYSEGGTGGARIEIGVSASKREYDAAQSTYNSVSKAGKKWITLLPADIGALRPGTPETRHNYFRVENCDTVFSHIRVNYFPDGGVARLRVLGKLRPNFPALMASAGASGLIDLVALRNGGRAMAWSDMHFGHPRNILRMAPGINMGDGWETARKMDRPHVLEKGYDGKVKFPGTDWVIIKLGTEGVIKNFTVDTTFFRGNYPESFLIEGCREDSDDWIEKGSKSVLWTTLCARSKLRPNQRHFFEVDNNATIPCTHLRLTIFPDGGIMRFRAFGTPTKISKSTSSHFHLEDRRVSAIKNSLFGAPRLTFFVVMPSKCKTAKWPSKEEDFVNILKNFDDSKYTFIIGNSRVYFTNYELKNLKHSYNKIAFFDPNVDSCEPIVTKKVPI
eukprot:UC4_evm3s74